MTYRPNKDVAGDICGRLLEVTGELSRELENDPEGRTLSLGVTMFFGTFMSAIDEDGRQMMCDAAQGYALQATELLDQIRWKK